LDAHEAVIREELWGKSAKIQVDLHGSVSQDPFHFQCIRRTSSGDDILINADTELEQRLEETGIGLQKAGKGYSQPWRR